MKPSPIVRRAAARAVARGGSWAGYPWASMRLLHVADRLTDRGGAYAWLVGVLEALALDHEVRLVVGEDDGAVRPPCALEVRPGLEARSDSPADLDDLVSAFAPHVVHVHNVVNPAVLAWAAGRRDSLLTVQDHRFFCPTRGKWTKSNEVCRRPMTRELCASCFEDRGYFAEVLSLTERRLQSARRMPVTVLSRYMRGELVAAGVPAAGVDVVPPFVHGLDPGATASGPPCVLFVGRLVESKGVRDAVEAWRRSGVDLPLVIAGTGQLRGQLSSLADRTPGLELLGWVERDRLSGLYRRARALLLPSRWQEPFGIAGLEALTFGVPVVAWESGGVGEWHPGPGLVPWGDVERLARALADSVNRRVAFPPSFERDEAIGRLLAIYGRIAGGGTAS
ncbi:MAG TPA: glycosyltransferase [Vicinamibacteria bacterium]|nr:glycosyltransferase [Vicinamibacteria bacterium]